jgi:hypothetical protein
LPPPISSSNMKIMKWRKGDFLLSTMVMKWRRCFLFKSNHVSLSPASSYNTHNGAIVPRRHCCHRHSPYRCCVTRHLLS